MISKSLVNLLLVSAGICLASLLWWKICSEDPAMGGIGTVIGHEMTRVEDQESKYDLKATCDRSSGRRTARTLRNEPPTR
jgi:hypothetical protein